jgi:hypothetical protein
VISSDSSMLSVERPVRAFTLRLAEASASLETKV